MINDFRVICDDLRPQLIGLSETWLSEDKHFDSEFHLNGFTLYLKDRKWRGGGIAVNAINGSNFLHEEVVIEDNIDFQIIVIKMKQKIWKPFDVFTIYVKPNAMNHRIIQQFNSILTPYLPNECLTVRDINFDIKTNQNNV